MIRALYIDDECDTERFKTKAEMLESLGIAVTGVADVREVLPTLERLKGELDVILLDILMPSQDLYSLEETNGGTTTGMRLLKDIRRRNHAIPVIIVSVKPEEETRRGLGELAINDYLTKPTLASEIAFAVKRALHHETPDDDE